MGSIVWVFVIIKFSLVFGFDPGDQIEEFDLEHNDYVPFDIDEILIAESSEYNSSERMTDRVISGQIAARNQFPYLVGMSVVKKNKKSWCGGSILKPDYILTAAHCLENAITVTIIFGAHDRFDAFEAGRVHREVSPENFIVHEMWNPKTLEADIALIQLAVPVNFTDEIQPVALPFGELINEFFEGYEGTTPGWGRFKKNCKKLSQVLRYFDGQIIHNNECQTYYTKTIGVNHMCLDGKKKQTICQGDSGGPLIIWIGNKTPIVVGIVSFGRCCDFVYPSVYTRVTQYLHWITQYTDESDQELA